MLLGAGEMCQWTTRDQNRFGQFSFSDVFSRELMSCALREGGREGGAGGRETEREREREGFSFIFCFQGHLRKSLLHQT